MARIALGVLLGSAFGFCIATATGACRASSSTDTDAEVQAVAEEAGVDPVSLAGAMNTTGLGAREYLVAVDELPDRPPPTSSAAPPGISARVQCIEAKESGGANVWNRNGSGAGGVLQYFPTTFARGAREIGHPEWSLWIPWQARIVAAHDLALGRRSQWTVSGC